MSSYRRKYRVYEFNTSNYNLMRLYSDRPLVLSRTTIALLPHVPLRTKNVML